MKFVKRRGGSTRKIAVTNLEEAKEQFLLDIEAVVMMEEIPFDLILNWDQTGLHVVPGSTWTMEEKGCKRVEIIGMDDKRQITAVICGSPTGNLLPFQLIYSGTTKACLPKYDGIPSDWHITCTSNHWSNELKMKEYLELIIFPYVRQKRKELNLQDDHPALAIFDVFKGQTTDAIYEMLEKNRILVVKIPANCTDRLQPMDLSVNKAVKDFLRQKFMEWYSTQVMEKLSKNDSQVAINFKLSTMKPLGVKWLIELFDYLKTNNSIIKNGFKAAEITGILNS